MQKEEFLSHPVFEKLEQLNVTISNETYRPKIDIENLHFFETFYAYTKDKLNLAIPILVPGSEMNALSVQIEAGMSQLNTFLGNDNIGHLTNAVSNFNTALNHLRNIPFPISKGNFNFSNAIVGFQKSVQDRFEQVNERKEKLNEDMLQLQQQIDEKNSQLKSLEAVLAAKEIEIQNVLIKYNTEFDAVKAAANTSIANDRAAFTIQFESDGKEFSETFEEQKEQFKTEFALVIEYIKENTTSTINTLKEKLEEAKKIVNIVGNVGVTGNYQNIANENKKSANFWRIVAVVFMVIMTGLIIWSIIDLSKAGFDLYKSIVRIIAAAVLTYPAIYAAKESSKHRSLETKNRNLELELASIGPFIEMLPEEKKQQVKEDLVKKYFTNNNTEVDAKEEEDVSIGGLEKILKALLPLIKK